MQYRNLKVGEIIRKGDEFYSRHRSQWLPVSMSIGKPLESVALGHTRRPIPEDDLVARMVRSTKRARGRTRLGKLENLIAERIRWQRKLTVAQSKLGDVNKQIATLATELANETFEKELSPCPTSSTPPSSPS